MAHKVTFSTVTIRKNCFLQIKLADKGLYSNGVFRLNDSKIAKWIYHVCKTKLGFTLKKCRNNQYLWKSINQQKILYSKGDTLRFKLQCYVSGNCLIFSELHWLQWELCVQIHLPTQTIAKGIIFLYFPSKYVVTTEMWVIIT